jgi:metal-responsive CopG/Arc/MetJ family transcriptional regulator
LRHTQSEFVTFPAHDLFSILSYPWWYDPKMKAKTSLTLSEDLVKTLDKLAGPKVSRSAFIENILRQFVDRRIAARRDARAVAHINKHATQLNAEMSDTLSFQSSFADE